MLIVGGRLFDGTGGPVVEDAAVVVVNRRIAAAGPAREVVPPPCARVLDAGGGLVLPGIIDNHVHLHLALERGDDVLTPWLRAGVTTLVDNGTTRGGVERLRRLAGRLSKAAPRLVVAGPIFTAPGGYPGIDPAGEAVAAPVADATAAHREVGRLLDEEGADLVKAAIERGFLADVGDPGWPIPSPDTLAAIVASAHARGRTARAHVTQPGELAAALDAGFDAAAHTPLADLPDELLARAAHRGFIFVTTVALWHDDPPSAAAAGRTLARYVRRGGRIALGTDAPFQPAGEMPLPEMRALAAAGLTPREVLLAATRDGAAAIGRSADLGTLEPGKLADLIVAAGDPLTDLGALADVRVVVRDGEVVVAPAPAGR